MTENARKRKTDPVSQTQLSDDLDQVRPVIGCNGADPVRGFIQHYTEGTSQTVQNDPVSWVVHICPQRQQLVIAR